MDAFFPARLLVHTHTAEILPAERVCEGNYKQAERAILIPKPLHKSEWPRQAHTLFATVADTHTQTKKKDAALKAPHIKLRLRHVETCISILDLHWLQDAVT